MPSAGIERNFAKPVSGGFMKSGSIFGASLGHSASIIISFGVTQNPSLTSISRRVAIESSTGTSAEHASASFGSALFVLAFFSHLRMSAMRLVIVSFMGISLFVGCGFLDRINRIDRIGVDLVDACCVPVGGMRRYDIWCIALAAIN